MGTICGSCELQSIKHIRDPNIEITTLVVGTLSTFYLQNVLGARASWVLWCTVCRLRAQAFLPWMNAHITQTIRFGVKLAMLQPASSSYWQV